MTVLTKEKSKVLAKSRGWSIERAEGYVEGERYRRRGLPASAYQKVGLDEYCEGFRASYYERGRKSPIEDGGLHVEGESAAGL